MASIWISGPRLTAAGEKRWDVRFEGPPALGADGKVRSRLHLGSFKSEPAAKKRAKWARNEWDEGRRPDPRTIGLDARTRQLIQLRPIVDEWLASRHKLAPLTLDSYARWGYRIAAEFPGNPHQITPSDVREWIGKLLQPRGPYSEGTVLLAHEVLRLVLDHAEVDPNPALHKSVSLPSKPKPRIRMPSRAELELMRGAMLTDWHRDALDFLEDTGVRSLEFRRLEWSMVHEDRILVPGAKGEGGNVRPRWIDNELWPIRLLDLPRGEGGKVWPRAQARDGMPSIMARACDRAGIPRYSPHDLRHLHASRLMWHLSSRRVADVAARLGHGVPMLLDTYTHVIPPADWR